MNAFLCMKWVRAYGGLENDLKTNLSVVEFVADKAKEAALNDFDVGLCDTAKVAAAAQIIKQRVQTREGKMMDLLELAGRVENGEAVNPGLALRLYSDGPDIGISNRYAVRSLDAAEALHDNVLPNFMWGIHAYKGRYTVELLQHGRVAPTYRGESETASAAWVAAILRAKHAEETP